VTVWSGDALEEFRSRIEGELFSVTPGLQKKKELPRVKPIKHLDKFLPTSIWDCSCEQLSRIVWE
jgi:hypothetical protein